MTTNNVPWTPTTDKIRSYKKITGSLGVPDDPEFYTSIAHWKPVNADQFAMLMHGYSTDDRNLDDHMHGLMTFTSLRIDRETFCTIWYAKKRVGASASSPVLMTMSNAGAGKVLLFASTVYGALATE